MKTITAALAIATILIATKVSAFPLKLTSFSGTITYNADYFATLGGNSNAVKKAFTLKDVLWMVTNQVAIDATNCPPAGSWIVWDNSYDGNGFYLTNSANGGYFFSLTGDSIASRGPLSDLASTFKPNVWESDRTVGGIFFAGSAVDGNFYVFSTTGAGILTNRVYSATNSMMKITCTGADYGEFKSSYDGVTQGSYTFLGSGDPSFWKTNGFKSYWLWWEAP